MQASLVDELYVALCDTSYLCSGSYANCDQAAFYLCVIMLCTRGMFVQVKWQYSGD